MKGGRKLDVKWDTTNQIEMSIFSIRRKLRAVVERNLEPYGLTPPHFYILTILKQQGTVRVTKLADYINVKPSAITVLMDRLVEMEYVTRSHSVEDRRVVMLELTPKGNDLFAKVLEKHNETLGTFFNVFEDQELEEFKDKLNKLEQAMSAASDSF
ncbi:MarR family winged helix-turn-helix transcriptional regulator [Peribacillus sp. SCS-155]|uniref:MarR family winged helix-turn-helix transcriptional regulator n=1 Tax=Peribacillus sedimenti TaxID=3115297 RepID=UPI003905C6F5